MCVGVAKGIAIVATDTVVAELIYSSQASKLM